MIPESAARIRANPARTGTAFGPCWVRYSGPVSVQERLKYTVLRPKVEPRHGFAIPLLTPRFAVLDSGSIGQNTGAQERRLP